MTKCYSFDFSGEFLQEFDSISSAARFYGVSVQTVFGALKRKSIVSSKLYFMPTKVFVRPIKKKERNPLFRLAAPYGNKIEE